MPPASLRAACLGAALCQILQAPRCCIKHFIPQRQSGCENTACAMPALCTNTMKSSQTSVLGASQLAHALLALLLHGYQLVLPPALMHRALVPCCL
jgi:hypothetical protein